MSAELERRAYEVDGRYIGRGGTARLEGAGYPVLRIVRVGGMYIVEIMQPAGTPDIDPYALSYPQHKARKKPWWAAMLQPRLWMWLAVLGAVGMGIYLFASGGIALPSLSNPLVGVESQTVQAVGNALAAVKLVLLAGVLAGCVWALKKMRLPWGEMFSRLRKVVKRG